MIHYLLAVHSTCMYVYMNRYRYISVGLILGGAELS